MKRFPIGLTIAVAVSLTILVTLGTWQVQRLHWKTDLLARIEAARTAAPIPLSEALRRQRAGEDMEWRRVKVECHQLDPQVQTRIARPAERHGLIYSVVDGEIAWRDLAPCAFDGDRVIPLERGIVQSLRGVVEPAGISVDSDLPSSLEDKDQWAVVRSPVAAIGVFRHAEPAPSSLAVVIPADLPGGFRTSHRDPTALGGLEPKSMGGQAKALITDFYVSVAVETPSDPALHPAPTPPEIPNRHLEYALTWYGLAGALVAIYAAMLWRRFKAK